MPDPLSELIPQIMIRLQREIKENREKIKEAWHEVVGRELGEWTRPIWISDGELLVEVDSSTIMDMMRYKSSEIVKRINERMEDMEISCIRFRLGG